jgi:hypothetical protein
VRPVENQGGCRAVDRTAAGAAKIILFGFQVGTGYKGE